MSSIPTPSSRLSMLPSSLAGGASGGTRLSTNGVSGVLDGMSGLSMSGIGGMTRMSAAGDPATARMSIGGSAYRQSTVPSLGGRTSMYMGRPSNMGVAAAAMGPIMITKDPRNIRDKSWQANAIRSLINFLVQAGYNQPVSPKTLQAPSAKDFQSIFKFLYAQLDPAYQFQKKFEEEVPAILKGLRYPFCDQISKSHLQSVGSMHAWPTLLAMLTWMVELILCCDQTDNFADFEEGGVEARGERVFFEYLTKAYAVFLAGDDNYDQMDQELIANFDRKNEKTIKDVERLTSENEVLTKEYTSLNGTESPLVLAKRENTSLQSDIEKFKQYINHLEQKKKKLAEQNVVLQEEIAIAETDIKKYTAEKDQLQKIVDEQQVSQADVERWNAERDQLSKTRQALAEKTDEQNKTLWEQEIALQKKMDQVERDVQYFNALAYRLGLTSSAASTGGVQFELEFNAQGNSPQEMISEDLQNRVKPVLVKLKSKYNSDLHKHEEDLIALQEQLDKLMESLTEKTEELALMSHRIQKLSEQYNEEKEAAANANMVSNKEMEVLERDLQRMKIESTNSLTLSQQRVQKMSIEYDQLAHRFHEAKARALSAVVRTIEDMIAFREHVTDSLTDLKCVSERNLQEIKQEALALNIVSPSSA